MKALRCVDNSEDTSYLPPLRGCLTVASTKLENLWEKSQQNYLIFIEQRS